MTRAVVFDLWQTLAVWPEEKSSALRRAWAQTIDVPVGRIDELWYGGDLYRLRETGPIAPAIAALHEAVGASADLEGILALRLELTREALVPVAGAVSTVLELRNRGVATGLISNCTEEVALVWDEPPFAGLFDVTVFSATARCMKPDARIYEVALEALGVPAEETLFIGDGANDELAGAERVGMTPVLLQQDEQDPLWDGLSDWTSARVTSIHQVLDLLT
jgi:putative hydrolase of the HAD superfamily